jgi:hypothetical protein
MRPWPPFFGNRSALFALLLASLVAGCATEEDVTQDPDFGTSVRHMITLQTRGAEAAGTGLDGVKADAALHAYRGDVAKPKEVETDLIKIRLGQ